MFSLLFATMIKRKWPLALVLAFLFVGELFLPVSVQAQSFSDTGSFYFTGQHYPRRRPIFREFMIPAGREEGLKVGPVRLHPFLGVAEVYTDNVFRKDTNRKSDFLTTIAPGIQALLPFGGGKHSVLLDYRAGQFLYKKYSQNNAFAQDAQGHVSLNFSSGLKMDLQGGRIDGFDPRGSEVDTQQSDITKWAINSIMGQVGFMGPRMGIRFNSYYFDWHYKNNGQAPRRDRTSASGILTLLANVTSSTSGLLGVQITNNNYDKNNQLDNFTYGVFSGFQLAPSRQISGNFNIGYSVTNYDRAPLAQPPSSGLSAGANGAKYLYMRGNLFWNPTSRLSISANPFRTLQQSAVFNTSNFIQTGVSIFGRQAITDRLALRGNFYYANDDFDTGRKDNRFRWRMGPEYRTLHWLGFRLDYIFEKRNSNQNQFDYYSNTIMLTIQGIL